MLRSLYSGVSGMKSQQIKMDTIGNNISNVNTTAFKSGRVTFKDLLSQTIDGGSVPTQGKGGLNPKQIGIGGTVASVDTDMGQGAPQPTGRPTDMAIEGNGFYVISDGVEDRFTRDGNFTLDENGSLISQDGYHVKGQEIYGNTNYVDSKNNLVVNDPTAKANYSISNKKLGTLDNITIPMQATLFTPLNQLDDASWDTGTTGSPSPQYNFSFSTGDDLAGWKIVTGNTGTTATLNANVDVNNKTITVDGDFQDTTTAAGRVTATALQNELNNKLRAANITQTITVTTGSGTPAAIGATTSLAATTSANSGSISTMTMKPVYVDFGGVRFNMDTKHTLLDGYTFKIGSTSATAGSETASVDTVNKVITLNVASGTSSTPANIQIAVNKALAAQNIPQTVSVVGATFTAPTAGTVSSTIDFPKDTVKLTSFGVDKDGTINGVYGNSTIAVGKIALANFQNAAGLEKMGGNTYRQSLNSGDPQIGDAASSGYGNILQGNLEMSNVDLAEQFTEMIITSRAFQANSKTITTSDDMLQQLINLKRD